MVYLDLYVYKSSLYDLSVRNRATYVCIYEKLKLQGQQKYKMSVCTYKTKKH